MEFKLLLGPFLLKLPSYAYSHIYDIVVYEVGVLAAVLVCFFKDFIKKGNQKAVYKKSGIDVKAKRGPAEESDISIKKAVMSYRRRNMLVLVIAGLLSEVFFQISAFYSDRINPVKSWSCIAFLVPVAAYFFVEVMSSWLGRLLGIISIIAVFQANKYYCLLTQNHHKTCYAIKALVVAYGIVGIIVQFFYVKKYNKPIKNEERETLKTEEA